MKTKKLLIIVMLLTTVMVSIGYSSFSRKLGIDDLTAIVREQSDIRITDFSINKATNDAVSTYEEYDRDNVSFGINLPNENSTIKYKITITNYGNVDNVIEDITGLPTNLEYELSNYTLGNVVCNEYNVCNLGIVKELYITIKYKEQEFDSANTNYTINISFDFQAIQNEYIYTYTGEAQTFTVPATGKYKIELWGAQGIDKNNEGKGAYTSGIVELDRNEQLYVYVGAVGTDKNVTVPYGILNFNGASGGSYTCYDYYLSQNSQFAFNHYGGSATDVRLTGGEWNDFESLKSRIMVAAGGASGLLESTRILPGAAGGGLTGYSGSHYTTGTNNTGATQTSTGEGIPGGFGYAGIPEYGGAICNLSDIYGASSGYYGGAAASGADSYVEATSGSGSSYISGHEGCDAITETSTEDNIVHTGQSIHYSEIQFINTQMIDGYGYEWTTEKGTDIVGMPSHDGLSTMNGNTGNGYAKITYLGQEEIEPVDIHFTGDINKTIQIPKGSTLEYQLEHELYEFEITTDSNKTYEIVDSTLIVENISTNITINAIEYVQVDYIKGDGTAYIDTGYLVNSNYRTEVEFYRPSTDKSIFMPIFGSRKQINLDSVTLWNLSSGQYRYDFYSNEPINQYGLANDQKHTFIQDVNTAYYDGVEQKTAPLKQFDTGFTMHIFSVNTSGSNTIDAFGTASYSNFTGRIYSFKMFNQSRELIVDYIPVYRKSDKEAGMYNIVNHRFYGNNQDLTKYPNSKLSYGSDN